VFSWRVALVTGLVLVLACLPVIAEDGETAALPPLWTAALAWLVPIGLGLVACGAVHPARVAFVIRLGWLALGVATVGYWACGFAFQFGALGFLPGAHPDLRGLVRQWGWSPFDASWGTQWGMLGLEGHLLRGPAATPGALRLFLVQLPWITAAVAISLWSLQGRTGPVALFFSALLVALVYTLTGNWVWGGGWLAGLGANLGLGHGFVDYAGAAPVHLVGTSCALAGMLAFGVRRTTRPRSGQMRLPTLEEPPVAKRLRWTPEDEPYVPMPPLYLPALATLGTWLAAIGWIGWSLSAPAFFVGAALPPAERIVVSLLVAAAGGALTAVAFSWLTTGQGNTLMIARGTLGALVAASAGLPFLPLWAALAVGAGAGLLVPTVHYVVEHVIRLDDPTSVIATHGVTALWGLLAVGVLADGRAGQGWSQVGGPAYLGVEGQGVTGYLPAPGLLADWPGQLQAQAAGAAAVFVASFLLAWLLFAVVQGLAQAWQGEYTIRLPKVRRRVRPPMTAAPRRWPRIRIETSERQEGTAAAAGPRPGGAPWWRQGVRVIASWVSRARPSTRAEAVEVPASGDELSD